MIEANRIWQDLEKQCGENLGFQKSGVLYLANSVKDMAGFENWLTFANAHQLDTRLLSASGSCGQCFPAARPTGQAGFGPQVTPAPSRGSLFRPWRARRSGWA